MEKSRNTALRLSAPDNTSQGLRKLREANLEYRSRAWPHPFDSTSHHLHLGDARQLDFISDESVHLVVTSPPYWTLKEYRTTAGQLGHIDDYVSFLIELDKVWKECFRVLVPGGRICCVVGDVCLSRKRAGRHFVMPLHADILVHARSIGLDCLTPVLWHKISNGVTEANGNGAGFYGKPYQPGAIVKNDIEHVLFLRKSGEYRTPTTMQKALSMLTKEEMQSWFVPIWSDIRGASTRGGHPAPFPLMLAERLIRMFSFAGDTVLDPFVGTGTTSEAAMITGRNSIGVEVDSVYHKTAHKRLLQSVSRSQLFRMIDATISIN